MTRYDHPVVIVEIRDLFLESPFEGAKLEKVTIKLPPRNDKRRADPKIISLWPRACLWVEWISPEGEECEADCAFGVQ
jgi:hypothetical protein